ncbi:MAG TPA: EscU/YscU/HrcU family type III secretion system export apparatus switch protein [Candidatus Bathyarchaeia archaeon]|nr:EscU/YscU/HrcU family type III secretion system export apparatus switch protein [Candidatus Bathyarchaeia archaeon]
MSGEKKEKRRHAVALRYNAQKDAAPRVVAKGSGLLADKIIEVAREHGVHVHEDAQMVALLAKVQLDSPIPEDLYRAVAEVLAFVYRLDQRMVSRTRTNTD